MSTRRSCINYLCRLWDLREDQIEAEDSFPTPRFAIARFLVLQGDLVNENSWAVVVSLRCRPKMAASMLDPPGHRVYLESVPAFSDLRLNPCS